MRKGATEPGGCPGGAALCVNAGTHSQAPANLVPKKIDARCKARDTCSAALQPLLNYSFEEQQPIITSMETHFSLNETWLTFAFYRNNFQINKL